MQDAADAGTCGRSSLRLATWAIVLCAPGSLSCISATRAPGSWQLSLATIAAPWPAMPPFRGFSRARLGPTVRAHVQSCHLAQQGLPMHQRQAATTNTKQGSHDKKPLVVAVAKLGQMHHSRFSKPGVVSRKHLSQERHSYVEASWACKRGEQRISSGPTLLRKPVFLCAWQTHTHAKREKRKHSARVQGCFGGPLRLLHLEHQHMTLLSPVTLRCRQCSPPRGVIRYFRKNKQVKRTCLLIKPVHLVLHTNELTPESATVLLTT